MRYKYGILYNEYDDSEWFWEFIKMYLKILLAIFIILWDKDVKVKGLICFVLIFLYDTENSLKNIIRINLYLFYESGSILIEKAKQFRPGMHDSVCYNSYYSDYYSQ